VPEDLDHRLADLRDGGVPALATAAHVRAHGDRLRRRRSAALAGAMVLLVGAIGSGVAVLTQGGGRDALSTADAPSAGPLDCEQALGVDDPPQDGDVVVFGGAYRSVLECRFDDEPELPVPEPENCPPPSGPEPGALVCTTAPQDAGSTDWDAGAAFLTPEQASAAEMPGWAVLPAYEPSAFPLLDPCPDQDLRLSESQTGGRERAMASEREAGGSQIVQEVARYVSSAAAAQVVQEYVEELARCPRGPVGDDGLLTTYQLVLDETFGDARQLLVRRVPCDTTQPDGQELCMSQFSTYLLVAQQADGVTVVDYAIADDGDPAPWAQALLDAVAAALGTAVLGS
jgi:hypothetical protein